jgi:TonB family protein
MPGPLLYKSQPRWQVIGALAAAVALHAAAVGIAALKPVEPVADLADIPEAVVEMTVEQQPPDPQPTPPPEEPEPVEQPPPPTEVPEFVEEQPTPPPKPKTQAPKPAAPIARPSAPAGAPTGPAPTGKAAMVFKPTVVYPYEARRTRATGSGVILVSVGPSGNVTDASMAVSTGSSILDNAATSTFKSARFKPGTVPKVKIPITFTLTGASY